MSKSQSDITLVIRLKDSGGIEITGPINNKMLCYGLLGVARDIIQTYNKDGKSESRIEVPDVLPKDFN